MINALKALFIKLVTRNYGRIKVALASGVVWLIMKLVTRLGLDIGPDWSAQVSVYAALGAGWLMESITAAMSIKGIKTIQDAIPNPAVVADGHAGDVTVGNVKLLAEIPLTMDERKAVRDANNNPPTNP